RERDSAGPQKHPRQTRRRERRMVSTNSSRTRVYYRARPARDARLDRVPWRSSSDPTRTANVGMRLPFDHPPEQLCLIRLSAIGDPCHTVPVVRAIRRAWPATKLTWIIGKTEHSLLKGLEGVDFVVLDKALGWRGYGAVRRALGGRRFDALLHMHASA